jgi:D-glycero-D-manno-heptose 1,7-bisphosphate phosphatase
VKAAFLDRDGVINLDTGYVHRWDEFIFAPGAIAAMRDLQAAGFMLIVVTNQAGIARGYYSNEQFETLTAQMLGHLEREGVSISAVYHCPHHPAGIVPALAIECDCRKPSPGMLLTAACEHGLSLATGQRHVLDCLLLLGVDSEGGQQVGIELRQLLNGHHAIGQRGVECEDCLGQFDEFHRHHRKVDLGPRDHLCRKLMAMSVANQARLWVDADAEPVFGQDRFRERVVGGDGGDVTYLLIVAPGDFENRAHPPTAF